MLHTIDRARRRALPFIAMALLASAGGLPAAPAAADQAADKPGAKAARTEPKREAPAPAVAPAVAAGDHWAFRRSDLWNHEPGVDIRVAVAESAPGRIRLTVKSTPEGGKPTETTMTADPRTWTWNWSARVGDQRLLAFPLAPGKKWSNEYKVQREKSERETYLASYREDITVTDWEQVKVPAGTFRALRVVIARQAMLEDKGGRLPAYGTEILWYSPDAKWYVKREFVDRSTRNRLLTHVVDELVEFGGAAAH